MRLETSHYMIPDPDKNFDTIEDAYFATSKPGKAVFGVADGLGGWAIMYGFNVGAYARALMNTSREFAEKNGVIRPVDILDYATRSVNLDGGATVVIASFDGNELQIANLGDCGARIVRKGRIILETKEQSTGLNLPYYVGIVEGKRVGYGAADADVYRAGLEVGDIVVLGSDGLFDNMHNWRIANIVGSSKPLEEQAKELAMNAFELSLNQKYISPCTDKSGIIGGKPDDITVVVAKCVS